MRTHFKIPGQFRVAIIKNEKFYDLIDNLLYRFPSDMRVRQSLARLTKSGLISLRGISQADLTNLITDFEAYTDQDISADKRLYKDVSIDGPYSILSNYYVYKHIIEFDIGYTQTAYAHLGLLNLSLVETVTLRHLINASKISDVSQLDSADILSFKINL